MRGRDEEQRGRWHRDALGDLVETHRDGEASGEDEDEGGEVGDLGHGDASADQASRLTSGRGYQPRSVLAVLLGRRMPGGSFRRSRDRRKAQLSR